MLPHGHSPWDTAACFGHATTSLGRPHTVFGQVQVRIINTGAYSIFPSVALSDVLRIGPPAD